MITDKAILDRIPERSDFRPGDVFVRQGDPEGFYVLIASNNPTKANLPVLPNKMVVATLVYGRGGIYYGKVWSEHPLDDLSGWLGGMTRYAIGARTLDYGTRKQADGSDTWRRHFLVEAPDGHILYIAGCRTFRSYANAMSHWDGPKKGAERAVKRKIARALYREAEALGWVKKSLHRTLSSALLDDRVDTKGRRPVSKPKRARKNIARPDRRR